MSIAFASIGFWLLIVAGSAHLSEPSRTKRQFISVFDQLTPTSRSLSLSRAVRRFAGVFTLLFGLFELTVGALGIATTVLATTSPSLVPNWLQAVHFGAVFCALLLGLVFTCLIGFLLIQQRDGQARHCACSTSSAAVSLWSLLRALAVASPMLFFLIAPTGDFSAVLLATLAGLALALVVYLIADVVIWPAASRAVFDKIKEHEPAPQMLGLALVSPLGTNSLWIALVALGTIAVFGWLINHLNARLIIAEVIFNEGLPDPFNKTSNRLHERVNRLLDDGVHIFLSESCTGCRRFISEVETNPETLQLSATISFHIVEDLDEQNLALRSQNHVQAGEQVTQGNQDIAETPSQLHSRITKFSKDQAQGDFQVHTGAQHLYESITNKALPFVVAKNNGRISTSVIAHANQLYELRDEVGIAPLQANSKILATSEEAKRS